MLDALRHTVLITAGMYLVLLAAYAIPAWIFDTKDVQRPDRIQRGKLISAKLLLRDRRQSILSLANIALMFALGDTFYSKFHLGFAEFKLSLVSAPLSFIGSMLVFDTWFYWMHRLIHQKPLYRWVHRWHHQSITPATWSNNSDRFVDNLFIQSYWMLAHFLLPVSPWVLLAHKIYDQVSGTIGHAGVEHGGPLTMPPSPMISVTHHDQHHRYFNCNYATHFTIWDRLMGTLHPDHDRELRENLRRRAQISGAQKKTPPDPKSSGALSS